MVTERQMEKQELSDGAIVDMLKPVLQGTKEYHDKIISMIAQNHETDRMTLEFKHYDLPVELSDPFWKHGEAERIIKCLNDATRQVFEEIHSQNSESNRDIYYDEIETKFVIDDVKLLSKINRLKSHRMLNKKIACFDGLVVSKSNVIPHIVRHVFKCYSCGLRLNDKVKKCIRCDSTKVDLSMSDSMTVETEFLTVQEHQDDMNPMSIEPATIEVILYGALTNKFFPGNHVRITGFPKIFNPKQGANEKLSKGYNTDIISPSGLSVIVEAHNIQHMKTPTEMLIANPSKLISDSDVKAIQNIRKKYNDVELLNVLTNSFGSNIYGHQAIRQSILIQNVGSSYVKDQRSNINILIIGDPGIGKTKLLKAAKDISLHAVMSVGQTSSGVGLTASVVRDTNGQPRLAIGAAVLANNGLLCLDELLNVQEEYRRHLLECMENGTLTVNKNGINQMLKTNAAFLMATNPDSGKYSRYNTLTENVSLSAPFLSRFDLIFVVLDNVNVYEDQKLRVHLAAIYNKTEPPKEVIEQTHDKISEELLKKYLVYAKLQKDDVKVSKEALKIFDNFHNDLRKPLKSSDVSATPRQFEGMLRIAMALTRLLLKTEVTEEISQFTMKLLNTAYESTGMKLGNSTGLNQTALFSKDLTKIPKEKAFIEVMKLITKDNTTPVTFVDMTFALEEHLHISKMEGEELIFKMDGRHVLQRPGTNTYLLDTSSYHT